MHLVYFSYYSSDAAEVEVTVVEYPSIRHHLYPPEGSPSVRRARTSPRACDATADAPGRLAPARRWCSYQLFRTVPICDQLSTVRCGARCSRSVARCSRSVACRCWGGRHITSDAQRHADSQSHLYPLDTRCSAHSAVTTASTVDSAARRSRCSYGARRRMSHVPRRQTTMSERPDEMPCGMALHAISS